jgi:hypothetical protein
MTKQINDECNCPCATLFARDEYQESVGNLPRTHFVLEINKKLLQPGDMEKIKRCIKTSARILGRARSSDKG